MVTKSYKSLEGQSALLLVLAGVVLLFFIMTGGFHFDTNAIVNQVDALVKSNPLNFDGVTNAYEQSTAIAGALGLGKMGALLVFVFKIWSKFSEHRTELKKTDLKKENSPVDIEDVEVKIQTAVNTYLNSIITARPTAPSISDVKPRPVAVKKLDTTPVEVKHKYPPINKK